MIFKKLRQKIESKRNSENLIWKIVIFLKDLCFSILKPLVEKSIDRENNKHYDEKYQDWLYETFKDMGILETPPISCNPDSDVEIHTLASHKHLFMYLCAIKSLLRFYNGVSVVVHDCTGDLTKEDIKILKIHIPGINVIEKPYADKKMAVYLKGFPQCQKYREEVLNSKELLDHIILAKKNKIITMNSDVLFLQKPEELISWIKGSKKEIVYVYEEGPKTESDILSYVGSKFPPHIVLALLCFYKDIMDLKLTESALKKIMPRFGDWCMGQAIYHLLIEKKSDKYEVRSFDQEKNAAPGIFKDGDIIRRSGIFKDSDIFRHYAASNGLNCHSHIKDAKKIISELKK